MTTSTTHQSGRFSDVPGRVWAIGGVGVALCSFVAAAAAPGGNESASVRIAAAAYSAMAGGIVPALYLVSALGLGRLATPLFAGARERWALQLAAGIAIALTLSQLMGVFGLLSSFAAAAAPVGVGLALLAHQLGRGTVDRPDASVPLAVVWMIPGAAILLVAACNPPGSLWASEFGGYDALSYHLQLPQEWIAAGRVWPVEHNVYSFLPGYVESAFVHVGVLMRVPQTGGAATPLHGLVAGDGMALIACQLLHAGLTLCATYLIARLTMHVSRESGLGEKAVSFAGVVSGAFVILTPWTVVVGSLGYNEMAMVALGAGAMLAASEGETSPVRRGLLAGALIGVACGAKPTALFFFGVPTGIVLLSQARRGDWVRIVAFGSVTGAIALSPWLIRNAIASGNPVFPFMTGVFGTAHWSAEQATRYAQGHSFDGSIIDRVALSFFVDPNDPAGARHRGLMHGQWAVFFPVVSIACLAAIIDKGMRRWGLVLTACLIAQYVLWLTVTHIQSRFLIPMLVPGAVVFGVVAAKLTTAVDGAPNSAKRLVGAGAIGLCLLTQAGALMVTFLGQRVGRPNTLLAAGPPVLSGEALRGITPMDRHSLYETLSPAVFINAESPRSEHILFVGESAPLYYRHPFVYATTWDQSVLGSLMAAFPGDGAEWTQELLERTPAIRFVLYDGNMTRRFWQSGHADPSLNPETIEAWLGEHGRLVRSWSSRHLFELIPPAAPEQGGTEGTP